MTTYTCKYHIYRTTGLFARKSCDGCTPDIINNPHCPNYAPVELKYMEKLGRVFTAVSKLEEDLK